MLDDVVSPTRRPDGAHRFNSKSVSELSIRIYRRDDALPIQRSDTLMHEALQQTDVYGFGSTNRADARQVRGSDDPENKPRIMARVLIHPWTLPVRAFDQFVHASHDQSECKGKSSKKTEILTAEYRGPTALKAASNLHRQAP